MVFIDSKRIKIANNRDQINWYFNRTGEQIGVFQVAKGEEDVTREEEATLS